MIDLVSAVGSIICSIIVLDTQKEHQIMICVIMPKFYARCNNSETHLAMISQDILMDLVVYQSILTYNSPS